MTQTLPDSSKQQFQHKPVTMQNVIVKHLYIDINKII